MYWVNYWLELSNGLLGYMTGPTPISHWLLFLLEFECYCTSLTLMFRLERGPGVVTVVTVVSQVDPAPTTSGCETYLRQNTRRHNQEDVGKDRMAIQRGRGVLGSHGSLRKRHLPWLCVVLYTTLSGTTTYSRGSYRNFNTPTGTSSLTKEYLLLDT